MKIEHLFGHETCTCNACRERHPKETLSSPSSLPLSFPAAGNHTSVIFSTKPFQMLYTNSYCYPLCQCRRRGDEVGNIPRPSSPYSRGEGVFFKHFDLSLGCEPKPIHLRHTRPTSIANGGRSSLPSPLTLSPSPLPFRKPGTLQCSC